MSLVVYGVDGKPKPAEPEKPAPCTELHCWHLDGEQHTIANHSDWKCCLCGKHHCVYTRGPLRVWEHGPHAGPSHQKGCGVVLGRVVLPWRDGKSQPSSPGARTSSSGADPVVGSLRR